MFIGMKINLDFYISFYQEMYLYETNRREILEQHVQLYTQSSRRAPGLWPKTSKTLFGKVNLFSFYLDIYIK
jgi:hypothetical protein